MAKIACAKNPKDNCWICTKPPVKYAVSHHVVGVQNDPDLTVDLCRGCHMLEKYLAQRKFLDNAAAVGRLITLARFHAGLPDARTFVYYETDEAKAQIISVLENYLHQLGSLAAGTMAVELYEQLYPHSNQIEEGGWPWLKKQTKQPQRKR